MTQPVQPQGFNLSRVLPCRQVRPFDDSMPAEAAVVRIAQRPRPDAVSVLRLPAPA
jgi:hypothetical protein